MKTSNSLIYKTNKISKGKDITVTIRLNDQCKNGHQDFSITADIYQAGKKKTDNNMISGGCCHDEILKAFPDFKMFVDLHMCDYLGNPMYATANGYYHLKNGFNSTPINSESFKNEFCEYYRIDFNDFDVLKTSESVTHYAILLMELDIPAKWKKQADEAIKKLEALTETSFLIDSVKNQFGMPSEDQIKEEKGKISSGFYFPEQKQARHEENVKSFINDLKKSANKEISAINKEVSIRIELFKIGGKALMDQAIYYKHTDSVAFNWRSYGNKITQAEADSIMNGNSLLSGIKYEVK